MTDQPDLQQIAAQLKQRYAAALESVSLKAVTTELNDLNGLIVGLPGEVSKLRDRGYAFAGYLSAQIDSLVQGWESTRQQTEQALRAEVTQIKSESTGLQPLVAKLDAGMVKGPVLKIATSQLEQQLEIFEQSVKAAEDRVKGIFEPNARQAREIKNRVGKLNWYMDRVDEATFEFNATEAVYLVATAEWIKTGKGKDDPDGLLYLTDQRLIFERKEKEGGFLGFGAKKVQGIEWELPLSAVQGIESEKKGFLGGKDIVHIQHKGGGVPSPVTVEVKGGLNANWYAQQLERAQRGDIDQERALEPDTEVVERVKNAPTACAACGAPFTTPITRAMTELACEYCGTIVRL
ncbi:MAG: hypothetical protein JXN59_00700 [Anaerolineae bacterium]|nr:hypothetical protein [Anaerolineae bacterium]